MILYKYPVSFLGGNTHGRMRVSSHFIASGVTLYGKPVSRICENPRPTVQHLVMFAPDFYAIYHCYEYPAPVTNTNIHVSPQILVKSFVLRFAKSYFSDLPFYLCETATKNISLDISTVSTARNIATYSASTSTRARICHLYALILGG